MPKTTEVINLQVCHLVRYCLPESGWTDPVEVTSRRIRDLTKILLTAERIEFFDAVKFVVRLPNGEEQKVMYEPLNPSGYYEIIWDREEYMKRIARFPRGGIKTHPSLEGHVFVFTADAVRINEQTVPVHA